MKVILLKQKRGLGKVGEVAVVKDGYGRNFLIPQGIAVRATPENEKMIEARKAELQKSNADAQKAAEATSSKISGKDFTFIRQCGDDGRLFGSVSAKDLASLLSEKMNVEISHYNVFLSHPIKSIGIHEVTLSLHADVSCNVLINVARSESEAKDALSSFKMDNDKKTADKVEASENEVEAN